MNNQIEIFENINVEKLFGSVNSFSIDKSLDNYIDSLDGFYAKYKWDTDLTLMRFIENFDIDTFSEDDIEFTAKALSEANYDESALRGERIILFSEPVILSDLVLNNAINAVNESESAVRLISNLGVEKKFTTKKSIDYDRFQRKVRITTYKVNNVVLGVILPKSSGFDFLKAVRYQSLHSDYKKLERVQKALQEANDIPIIEVQKVRKRLDEINSIIKGVKGAYETIQKDVHAIEQEKSHVENILENSKDALEKTRSDLDKTIREFDKLTNRVADESEKLENIQAKVTAETGLLKKEQDKFNALKVELAGASESLTKIKAELADAKREKNLTNFDTLGHSIETGRQLVAYYWFAGVTFIGLISTAIYMFWNGQRFSELLPHLSHVSAWDILLSRLPLVAATILIIGGLSGVFYFLVKHIVSLNTEKMTMLKAGILAEQITNSLDIKGMESKEILDFQRNTKIKLIMQVFSKNEPDTNQNNTIIEAIKTLNSK